MQKSPNIRLAYYVASFAIGTKTTESGECHSTMTIVGIAVGCALLVVLSIIVHGVVCWKMRGKPAEKVSARSYDGGRVYERNYQKVIPITAA